MSKARIWRLSINLDVFNAVSASFYSDEARALAFQGLSLGMNDGICPSGAPEAFRLAFEIGKAAMQEAKDHQECSARGGKSSAKSRKEKSGSAQPFRSDVEGGFEGGFEVPIEGGVEAIHKPQATNLKPASDNPKSPHKSPKGSSPRSASSIPSFEDFETWAYKEHPDWVSEARAFYRQMASQDWITTSGRQILNAKGTFNTWLREGWIKRIPPPAPRRELVGC